MIKISGLDEFSRQLEEAQAALADLDGELGTISFDPYDPASIEAAIIAVERMVDERLGQYESNPIVGPIITQARESYRSAIVEKATEARTKGNAEDDQNN